jgi:MbtH protein
MSFQEQSNEAVFEVVMNDEEQYSIWPAEKVLPAGWRLAGKRDVKAACLEFIDEAWMDMRPLSLRREMVNRPA